MREIHAGFQESLAKKLPGMRTEDTKYLFSPSQLRDISVDLKFTPNCTQKEKSEGGFQLFLIFLQSSLPGYTLEIFPLLEFQAILSFL